jgi:Ca2+-transporting ATPase
MDTAESSATDTRALAVCVVEKVYSQLETGPKGLSTKEAKRRLKEHGPNLLPEQKKQLLRQKLYIQLKNLFNLLLIIAAILSFIAGITSKDMTSINMGLAILVAVVISILFAIFQERRAERAVEAIKELVPSNTKVMRDGRVGAVPVADIVPGDILSLEEGDKVPADARVLESFELSVDNSTLTGESEAQHRTSDPKEGAPEKDLVNCANMVFAGTTVAAGSGTAVVLTTGSNTQFGRAIALSQEVEEPMSPLQQELDRTAKINFALSFVVGFIFLLIARIIIGLNLTDSLLFMIGVVVSLVPEGLQVTVTLSLAVSSLAMSRRHVVVKRLSAVETLGSTSVICSDKTGTITEGQMTVKMVWMGGRTLEVTGEGYEPEGQVMLGKRKIKASDLSDLSKFCEVAALANTATLVPPLDPRKSRWTAVGDSTEAAILVLSAKAGVNYKQANLEQPRVGMLPFESTRKMMSSIHRTRSGELIACVKGAPHEIVAHCAFAYWKDEQVPMTPELAAQIIGQIDEFARGAYRVLALAYHDLPADFDKFDHDSVEHDITFLGLVAILDPPRPETADAVLRARSAGVRIVMLTGDHKLTAEAIAKKVGIITSAKRVVMTGDELSALSDKQLSKVLDAQELVFARITPEQKLRVVRAFRAKGEVVAVTGDGVNDAPALLEADIGVSMGLSGTDVARESSDMVLMDDNFASIVNGIEEGRAVFDNLKKFIVYVYSHNWAELLTFIALVLFHTPLPLAVVQVLAIDLVMELPPSLSLTVEPPEPGIMERKPRQRGSRLFDLGALARSAFIGVLIGLAALFFCFQTWAQAGWSLGSTSISDQVIYIQGTTVVLATIMVGQLGTLFATRTNVKSAFSVSPLKNKWLLRAVAVELVILLAIVYVPFLNPIFMTGPVPPIMWPFMFTIVPIIILFEEGRKAILRTFVLPAPTAVVKAAHIQEAAVEGIASKPFVVRAPPIIMLLSVIPGTERAAHLAIDLGKHTGARVIFIRPPPSLITSATLKALEVRIKEFASGEVPYEYINVHRTPGKSDLLAQEDSVIRVAKVHDLATVIVPVEHRVLAHAGWAQKSIRWLRDLRDKNIILVHGPGKPVEGPVNRPFRLLIPMIDELRQGPFDLAGALNTGAVIPSVDVVAARILELPRFASKYSIYRRDSLAIGDEQLSFIKTHLSRPMQKLIQPMVLLVHHTGGDIAAFAKNRNIDLLVMEGKWRPEGEAILSKVERDIADRAGCTIVVTMPHGLSKLRRKVVASEEE